MLTLNYLLSNLRIYFIVSAFLITIPVFSQVPTISSFSPASAVAGSTVTITGTNFSPSTTGNIVYFGAVQATVSAATTTSLSVTVPAGATYKPISVTTNNLTAWSAQPIIPVFANGGKSFTNESFADKIDSATGLYPYGIVIVDLDGDGKPDIATANNANSPSSTISVLRNTGFNGSISFASNIDFAAPSSSLPYYMAAGDIDGDGKQDLVITSTGTNTLSVYRNTSSAGVISFASRLDFSTGTNPYSVSMSDLDGDGKPDLAVSNFLSNTVSIFRNKSSAGTISFAAKTDLATGLGPHTVAIGDLDGDKKPDIAVTNTFSYSVSLFRNQSSAGTISFNTKVDVTTGTDEPFAVAIGDLDADGRPDLAVTNDNFNLTTQAAISLTVLKNTSTTGNFSFASRLNYGSGDAFNVAINDLNGDAKPEVIVPISANLVSVYPNTGSTGVVSLGTAVNFFSSSPYAIAAGDLDNDNLPELAVANFISTNISILKNKVTSPVVTSFTPTAAGPGKTITITGTNFTGATAVSFGGVPAASFNVVSDNTITAVTGAGASGDVSVTNAAGTAGIPGFTFIPAPVITSFTPTSGTTGTTVTITGTDFTGATTVTFGGTPASSFTVNSSTSITAVVNTGATGNVSVTTAGGIASQSGFVFTGPVVSSFTPATGAAGTTVTITGVRFTGATDVRFGGISASSFIIDSDTQITAVVGQGATGSVSVITPAGTGALDGFTHTGPAIQSFTPALAGEGSVVTITGLNFTGVTAVYFGSTPASSFTVESATTIKAVVAAGSTGNISVVSPNGTGIINGFTYSLSPIITSFAPSSGGIGSVVTISGANFSNIPDSNKVYFGAVKAVVTAATKTSLTVTVPYGATFQPIKVTVNHLHGWSKKPFIVTFSGGSINSSSFDLKTDFAIPSGSYDVEGGDLNLDGKTDLIASDFDGGAVSLFKNKGTAGSIAFDTRIDSTVTSLPNNVAIEDFDGDGMLDIAVANWQLSVLRNTSAGGNISVSSKKSYPAGSVPYGIVAGDIDQDGRADIAITNYNTGTVSIYRNTGSVGVISFDQKPDITTGTNPQGVFMSDLDGDDKPDMVIVNNGSNTISVFRNTSTNGNISFANKVDYATGSEPFYVCIGDLNNDDKPDLAVTNFDGSSVSIFKNTSSPANISFAAKSDIGIESPRGIAMGDLDGDGMPDLAVTDYLSGYVYVLKNTSTGNAISFAAGIGYKTGGVPQKVFIGDLDGDGKPDLSIANINSTINILRNKANEPAISSFTPSTAGAGTTITITGSNFTNVQSVTFGNIPASSFTVVSPTTITATVAGGASGNVTVTTGTGSAVKTGFTYLAVPLITASPGTTICDGNQVILSTASSGINYWYRNGTIINGSNQDTLQVRTSGTYTVIKYVNGTFSNASQPVTVTVNTIPPKPTITWDAVKGMISSASSGNQWYIDTTTAIVGANGNNYKPSGPGYFSVKVTENGCTSSFANRYYYLLTATVDLGAPDKYIRFAPNPVNDYIGFTFSYPGIYTVTVQIADINGRIVIPGSNVRSGGKIYAGGLMHGMYFLMIHSADGAINVNMPFIKL